MPDTGTPPPIPLEFQIYDSYVEDPHWQRRFSAIWVSLLGAAVLVSLPHLVRSIRSRRAFPDFFGIRESLSLDNRAPIWSEGKTRPGTRIAARFTFLRSALLWSPPGFALNAGQLLVILTYITLVFVCIVLKAPLSSNANRPGFIALSQLPVVYLFATKNSVLSLLLGPGNGYEKLNYIHRWSGRCIFFAATLHGSLWIQNHLTWDIPILGQQKETSGVAAFGLLCVIVLFSLKPIRRWFYQVFFITHVLASIAFFITICYHTPFAPPWIFPPLAFYGLDILMRMLRYRIKDATLMPVDEHMTIIRVADCDSGWQAGQHVKLRIFFSGRVFDSHPFTILNAPSSTSCLSNPTLILGARVTGDWTRALNEYARNEIQTTSYIKEQELGSPVQVMLDGPYGGCHVDLGRYKNVLLVAGGSGVTFTLGLLDDIVGRCVKLERRGGEITKKIEFSWCLRSFGSILWFAPFLVDIANTVAGSSLDLHITIFVTCLCEPDAVPEIPNCDIKLTRPSVYTLLLDLISPSVASPPFLDVEKDTSGDVRPAAFPLQMPGPGGGVAVCASGPESMTREAQNAVARLGMSKGTELGEIALHAELFAL